MGFGWLGDPDGARHRAKDAAVARLATELRAEGFTDQQVDAAKRELRAALAGVTTEEYPTQWEYTEAVEAVTDQVAARPAGRPG